MVVSPLGDNIQNQGVCAFLYFVYTPSRPLYPVFTLRSLTSYP